MGPPRNSSGTYSCLKCYQEFDDINRLYKHKNKGCKNKRHQGRKPSGSPRVYFCKECNYYFDNAAQLKTHIDIDGVHHYKPSSAREEYNRYPSGNYCKPCNYYFQYTEQLIDHIDLGHPYEQSLGPSKHVCQDCSYGFGNAEALRTHNALCDYKADLEPTPGYSHVAGADPHLEMLDYFNSLKITGSRNPIYTPYTPGSGSIFSANGSIYTPDGYIVSRDGLSRFTRWRDSNPYDSNEEPAGGTITPRQNFQSVDNPERSFAPTREDNSLSFRGSGAVTGNGGPSNKPNKTCPLCSKKFKSESGMKMHLGSKAHAY